MDTQGQMTWIGDKLHILAPAKINLSLLIAGKRPDGFHDIETVMAKIDLCDKLILEQNPNNGIKLICTGKYLCPDGPENLVYRACQMLYKASPDSHPNIKITLTKNIPLGSGLGGASSDAAAILQGLNIFANLGINNKNILEIADKLGSDVPFFLGSPLAFCAGKGEKIEKIEKKFEFSAILALPSVNSSTKRVYENYTHDPALYNQLSRQTKDLIAKKRIDLLSQMCANMLQDSCFQLYEELADLRSCVNDLQLGAFCLTGSGSAMYRIVPDAENVERYQSILANSIDCEFIIVHNKRV